MSLITKLIVKRKLIKYIDNGIEYLIIDVREPNEYSIRHVNNSINIPYTQLNDNQKLLPSDKDMPIFIYCRSGRRSKIAYEILTKMGYTNITDVGSINNWSY